MTTRSPAAPAPITDTGPGPAPSQRPAPSAAAGAPGGHLCALTVAPAQPVRLVRRSTNGAWAYSTPDGAIQARPRWVRPADDGPPIRSGYTVTDGTHELLAHGSPAEIRRQVARILALRTDPRLYTVTDGDEVLVVSGVYRATAGTVIGVRIADGPHVECHLAVATSDHRQEVMAYVCEVVLCPTHGRACDDAVS